MLPTYMTQSQVFWQRGRPSRNIRLFSVFVPTQDTEKPLSRMFPANWGLALTFQRASSPSGKSCQNAGSLSALWLGSTIPAVFPKTMKCLSVLLKRFAPLLPSALCSSGFSLLVQLLSIKIHPIINIKSPICIARIRRCTCSFVIPYTV